MGLEVTPFSAKYLDDAAQLLATRQQTHRLQNPYLPERFADPNTAQSLIQAILNMPGATGWVALRSGKMVGYLVGRPVLTAPTALIATIFKARSAIIPYEGHVCDLEETHEVYSKLYAAISRLWVERGYFAHYIEVPASDPATLAAWADLGFGRDRVLAGKDTNFTTRTQDPALEIRQARPEDIDIIIKLELDLFSYHSAAPIYHPYLPEALASLQAIHEKGLADPTSVYWLAYRANQVVGLEILRPPPLTISPEILTPEHATYLSSGYTLPNERSSGVGTALLARSMRWAKESGYTYCTLHYASSNWYARHFWQQNGFAPISYRLSRLVDERIAWATTDS
jgi:ribosomal protein S18 acetylase RimI-like enzyme